VQYWILSFLARHLTLYYSVGFTGIQTASIIDSTNVYFYIIPQFKPLFNPRLPSDNYAVNYDTYNYIYMEIDGLNTIDEYLPYTESQYNLMNSGISNASFAKMKISTQDSLITPPFVRKVFYNYKYFNPPAERIRKLKIKFRYNNNVLVNFNGGSYSFILEFTLYDNQIQKKYNLSRPVIMI
jgi:hypothetical protein